MIRHVEWYKQWLKTGDITPGKLQKLRHYSSRPEFNAAMNHSWQVAFDLLSINERQFLTACLSGKDERIVLSTIHGSKGGEADNVVIFGDYTEAVANTFKMHPAQEFACLYVGMTRAKKNLYLVSPNRMNGYNWRKYQNESNC